MSNTYNCLTTKVSKKVIGPAYSIIKSIKNYCNTCLLMRGTVIHGSVSYYSKGWRNKTFGLNKH